MNKLKQLRKSIEDHTGGIVIAAAAVTVTLIGVDKIINDHSLTIDWTNLPESLTEALICKVAEDVVTLDSMSSQNAQTS